MPRNKSNEHDPKKLVGKNFIYNPFSGKTELLFAERGSRKDYICGNEMNCESTETQKKNSNIENAPINSSTKNHNIMDIEPSKPSDVTEKIPVQED